MLKIMVPLELIDLLRITFHKLVTPLKQEPYNNDETIVKTIEHIEKVVENILILADSLGLSENEKVVAEMIASFQDMGKLWILLPENSEYKIIDHAEASIECIKLNEPFNLLDNSTQDLIIQVIRNHNKPVLLQKENETLLFYSKLLRDADKLDIWRATSEYLTRKAGRPAFANELSLSDKGGVTPSFCKLIIEGGIPDKNDLVTFHDFIIFQMSWVFDLHFKKSFQILNQKQYVRHLYDSLPKNDSVIEIYRMLRIYIENRI